MRLAILFWFYKDPEICINRLEILRQHNLKTPIYGLYGGDLSKADLNKTALDKYLDDFYVFSEDKDTHWKWIQGDLMIAQWYRDRGKDLDWDTVIIVQWDMLVFESVDSLFSMLQKDHLLLSGLRPIHEVEKDWMWVAPKNLILRSQYLEFIDYIKLAYNYNQTPLGCIFIVVGLPRIFLESYANISCPELGFLEYRIPIYAQIFGIPFCENHSFNAWWVDGDPLYQSKNPIQRLVNLFHLRFNPNPLNPTRNDVSLLTIYRHLINDTGARIFHPYQKIYPFRKCKYFRALLSEFKQDCHWLFQKLKRP
jgi:hypothetical protein